MWREFLISGYKVCAKVYDLPSKHGVLGFSRVSKMEVYNHTDKMVMHHERGLVFNHLPEEVYHEILTRLSDLIGGLI